MTKGRIACLAGMVAAASCLAAGPVASLAPATVGAPPCRVRNVIQDSVGRSLIRMVEQAVDGDRLQVRGTCPGEVVIMSDIVIRGMGDRPTLTGRDRMHVVKVGRGVTARLRGLTIEHGAGTNGGGINNRGSLTLVESTVRRNSGLRGGGIYSDVSRLPAASLTLVGSTVRANVARDWGGGGIYAQGTVMIIRSRIVGNETLRHRTDGGGILAKGSVTITRLVVRGNVARGDGGGIRGSSGLTITRSSIADNRARRDGGGISSGPGLTITDATISGNVAGDNGGGIMAWDGATITRSSITDNRSGTDAGGIGSGPRLTITDSTISGNVGGGIAAPGPHHHRLDHHRQRDAQ